MLISSTKTTLFFAIVGFITSHVLFFNSAIAQEKKSTTEKVQLKTKLQKNQISLKKKGSEVGLNPQPVPPGESQLHEQKLQNSMQRKSQTVQTMSNIQKKNQKTKKAVVKNMKGEPDKSKDEQP